MRLVRISVEVDKWTLVEIDRWTLVEIGRWTLVEIKIKQLIKRSLALKTMM